MNAMRQSMPEENELVITRILDAPRERVWQMWTDPHWVVRWWGPKDFTSPVCQIDLREGGRYFFSMQSPEGEIYYSTGIYKKIDRPNELVFTDSFADENGNVVPASHYGMSGDFPLELEVTVTLDDNNGKTTMMLSHMGIPAGEMSDQTQQGWQESFDKMESVLRED